MPLRSNEKLNVDAGQEEILLSARHVVVVVAVVIRNGILKRW